MKFTAKKKARTAPSNPVPITQFDIPTIANSQQSSSDVNIHVFLFHIPIHSVTGANMANMHFVLIGSMENRSMVIFTQASFVKSAKCINVTSVSPVTLEPIRIIPHISTSAQFTVASPNADTQLYEGGSNSVIALSSRD